jgi:hypothetical protein
MDFQVILKELGPHLGSYLAITLRRTWICAIQYLSNAVDSISRQALWLPFEKDPP